MRSRLALIAILIAGLGTPALADFDEKFSLEASTLVLKNLIGEITIEGHGGSAFEVEVMARGKDASRENLEIETREGRTAEVLILFPVDREKDYVYPKLGHRSHTTLKLDSDAGGLGELLSQIFGGGSRIHVRGSGRGLELWADVKVRVPRGTDVDVNHGVGRLLAQDVEAALSLDINSGAIEARSIRGDVIADTGSGKVVLQDVAGDISVDTGSGSVELLRLEGDRIDVDTGSGRIRFDTIRVESIVMDTGSGSVRGRGLSTDEAEIDTGSGSVEVHFDRVGDGRFVIDTGSGGIRLALPSAVSARIHAETGSGGIHVNLDGAQIRRMSDDEVDLVLGGGAARFNLDTGSGSIHLSPGD